MRNIRKSTFETNSSSCHSIVFSDDTTFAIHALDHLIDSDDDSIHITLGEFGCDSNMLTAPEEKLSYLVTLIGNSNGIYADYERDKEQSAIDIMDTDDFGCLDDSIYTWIGHHVVIDPSEGYVDHQSVQSIYDLLNYASCSSIFDFVFNNQYMIKIYHD